MNALVLTAILSSVLGCSEDVIVSRRVPGTERMDPNGSKAWFTISPDDKWMAFMEIDSIHPTPPNREGVPTFHLVTMSLETMKKTHHTLGQVPDSFFRGSDRPWQDVQAYFEVDSWGSGSLYFEIIEFRANTPWIAFTPGIPPAEVARAHSDLRCSDCAPKDLIARRLGRRSVHDVEAGLASVPFGGDVLSPHAYLVDKKDMRTVFAVDQTGKRESVLRVWKFRTSSHVFRVRVSPDDRYLAYVVEESPRIAIPFAGYCEVYLMDLETRRKVRIQSRYDYVSGILWTSDSNRFYYAAISPSEHGVYVVDVNDMVTKLGGF